MKKLIALAVLIAAVIAFFVFDLNSYFSLEAFKEHKTQLDQWVEQKPLISVGIFFLVYVAATGLSLPGAAVLTLVAGALFGLFLGTVVVSFASAVGATLAFLIARFMLGDTVQNKFSSQMKRINRGLEKDGVTYLLSLRLLPVFPFFVINLVMGLTKIRVWTFYWVSQVGMLAGTIVYVNAGTQLSQIESLSGVLSPQIWLSFLLIGFFPLITKGVMAFIKSRKALKSYKKPKKFDRNLVVIGAGSAGLVSSYIAATVNAKVTLVEKHKMGGDCLNTGCVPSKALIRSAKFAHDCSRAKTLGFTSAKLELNFADVMDRVHDAIKQIEPHDSVERYTQLGVECLQGEAKICSPYEVQINGQTLTTRNIVVATGARPRVPDMPGLRDAPFYTSDTIWNLRDLPKNLAVLGGGPIGCEMAQAFARLGSSVTIIQRGEQILPKEDQDIAQIINQVFEKEGIEVLTDYTATAVQNENGQHCLVCESSQGNKKIVFDAIFVALGRQANVTGFGLEELGVKIRKDGTIETNEQLQTTMPTIFAAGDVTGPYQFTHVASHQSWYASVNSLFGWLKTFSVDYRVIPWTTFTDPEVARVGLSENEAKQQDIKYEVTRYDVSDLDRAIADQSAIGVVKILTQPGKDKILGVTIVSAHASEMLAEFNFAMKNKIGLNKILGTIHTYPTFSEANKYAAGEWKKNHKPKKALAFLKKLHTWRRG